MCVDFATATSEQHELELDGMTDATPTSTRPRRAASKRKILDLALDEEDDDEDAYQPVKKRGRQTTTVTKTDAAVSSTVSGSKTEAKSNSKSKQVVQKDADEGDEDEVSVKPAKRAKKKSSTNLDDDQEDDGVPTKPVKRARKKSSTITASGEEKRARRFRDKAPQAWQDLYDRATTQRMFVLDRTQTAAADIPSPQLEAGFDPVAVPPDQAPSATVVLAGTTGNIYS